jgi:SAM-dependent methyltransferase
LSIVRPPSHYTKAYFDKWYRHPRHRVKSATDIERQLRFVVAATEYLFERPVRKVLDVGAGEGNWSLALKKVRPGASYYGVDASEYAVGRYGKKRNIRLGTFGQVGELGLPDDFDLVLCCGVLNYVSPRELATGLRALAGLCVGAAYYEVFSSADDATGDFTRAEARQPRWWRALFRRTGWSAMGMHLYLPTPIEGVAAALERAR